MTYYIYEIWDSIKNIPIYVGYGKHNRKGKSHQRYEDHFCEAKKYKEVGKSSKSANLYKLNVINEVLDNGGNLIYKFPFENISLSDAYKRETELILLYGRRDLETGSLTNLDSGGRGGREWSQISKDKLSKTNSGRVSPTKGMKFGEYSENRRGAISAGKIQYHKDNPDAAKSIPSIFKKGREPWNKGRHTPGEIFWIKKDSKNKRIPVSDLQKWISNGWVHGR
jgi:hypothetical protein